MPNILLVPDVFFHRWDQADGELWLCLRSFVLAPGVDASHPLGRLEEFHAWAADPHGKTENFRYSHDLTDSGDCVVRLAEGTRAVPVTLPTNVDVWMRITRGPNDPATWLRVARSRGCLTSPVLLPDESGTGDPTPGVPASELHPFVFWFNEKVKARHDAASADEKDQLSAWLELRLESGKQVAWKHEEGISGLFRNEADPARPALPLFRPDQGWGTGFPAGARLETNLFWLCGQMLPLGRKPVATGLATITGIDIWLVRNDVGLNQSEPDLTKVLHKFELPKPQPGIPKPYFSQLQDRYAAAITCAMEDAAILLPGTLAVGGPAGPVAYFSPALRAYTSMGKALPGGWEHATGSDKERNLSPKERLARLPLLKNLAGVQVRAPGGSAGAGHAMLKITPALVVQGKLRLYRRFPRIVGVQELLLPTVMVFEPDSGAAELLEIVAAAGPGFLARLFASAAFEDGWQVQLLQSDPLPWDGPERVYRVLALPPKDVKQTDPDGQRTCTPRAALLRLALSDPLSAPRSFQDVAQTTAKWLWKPSAVASPQELQQDWQARAGAAAGLPVTSLLVDAPAALTDAVDALVLGDYTFFLANSRLRIERYLGVSAPLSDGSTANCTPNQTPLQDYEDDLVNYNTARVRKATGELLDERVRFAQGADQQQRQLNRRQVIPLLFEWPREPNDQKKYAQKSGAERPALTWADMKDYVRFAALDTTAIEPFAVELEHTYATSMAARAADGTPVRFGRDGSYDWPIAFPTAAECSDFAAPTPPAPPAPAPRFLVCAYDENAGAIRLSFDARLLDPDQLTSILPAQRDREALALSAWRSVAELAAAGEVALLVEYGLFDLGGTVGVGPAQAARQARDGFSGRWRDAVQFRPRNAQLPAAERARLAQWADAVLHAASPAFPPLVLTVPIDSPGWKLGQESHVARAGLVLARAARNVPSAVMRLVPITLQAGLGRVAPDSLWGAWAQLGFGPGADVNTLPSEVKTEIIAAFGRWQEGMARGSDSITPQAATVPAPARARARTDIRTDNQGLIAELDGTDWFVPPGSPSTGQNGFDIEPQLLPFGFAPCARHPVLGEQSQEILQRVLASLRDGVDLAYDDWARTSTPERWVARMGAIAALAKRDGADWSGPLPGLVTAIVDTLLAPQPDHQSTHVQGELRAMSQAYVDKKDQIGTLGLAVRRMLLEDLALFADAKALLLTRAAFVASAAPPTPPPGTLARAGFTRMIRPDAGDPKAKVDAVVGWKQLVAAGESKDTPAVSRMGFLEVLDDARYDNAFEVAQSGQTFESFEAMVDAGSKAQEWHVRAPLVPAAAENGQTADAPRELRLASRNIVSPPELLWSGVQDDLAAALALVGSGKPQNWTLKRLSSGAPPGSEPSDLVVGAYRRNGGWNVGLTVDQRLVHFVYRVRGDEEGTVGTAIDAFENDGFFIRGLRNREGLKQALDGTRDTPPALNTGTEHALRAFLEVNRGTAPAAALTDGTLLNNLALYDQLERLVFTEKSPALSDDAVLLRPRGVGGANGDFCLGAKAAGAAFLDRVRHAVLFPPVARPGEGAGISAAYLVVSVALDVWTGWDVLLTQSRNMPLEDWSAACGSISGRRPAPFARVFWQATEQASMLATQHVANSVANGPRHWDAAPGAHRVFELPKEWIGVALPAKTVLERLLFQSRLWVGSHRGDRILDAGNADLVFGTPFSMTVYQEQFVVRNGPPQAVRHPFPSFVSVAPGGENESRIWFSEEYASFSIDIRWIRPRGTVFLSIERMFAVAP